MPVKCVVWDLDNTMWNGILAEGDDLEINSQAIEALKALDNRGILNSIASRNDREDALKHLEKFGISEYFLYPQINWVSKSDSISRIAENLQIGIDTLIFLDDDPFERAEVSSVHPQVRSLAFTTADSLLEELSIKEIIPTEEGRGRRELYRNEISRCESENTFSGTHEEFLSSLGMSLEIRPACPEDLRRAEELVQRTNQLNSTGHTYSYDELSAFSISNSHSLLLAKLQDRFGDYGTIGVALCEHTADKWRLLLLLMSCRILARGIGTVFLNYLVNHAVAAGMRMEADFRITGRNRIMYVTYKFSGFTEVREEGNDKVLLAPAEKRPLPSYVTLLDYAFKSSTPVYVHGTM